MKAEAYVAEVVVNQDIIAVVKCDRFQVSEKGTETGPAVKIMLQDNGKIYLTHCSDNKLCNLVKRTMSYKDFCTAIKLVIT